MILDWLMEDQEYVGIAAMSWFVHPWLMIVSTIWSVRVLYAREFRSRTLEAPGGRGVEIAEARRARSFRSTTPG